MKVLSITALILAFGTTTVMAGGHGPAAANGKGDGKGRKAVAFEVSKSARQPGSTAKDRAALLTEAIRAGKDGGFVKDED